MTPLNVALDASRIRSGGGVAHLLGILDIQNPLEFGIREIHVWAYARLLEMLPDRSWLVKHHPPALEKSLSRQLWWQATKLSQEIADAKCDILFSAEASTFCRFQPMVVLNQNMLAYDKGVLSLFGFGRERFKQLFLYYVQKRAFHRSTGSIFLTQHANNQVQRRIGILPNTAVIPHGVSDDFKRAHSVADLAIKRGEPLRLLYVSPVFEYKHQIEVVEAVKMLRERGLDAHLTLAGGGSGRGVKQLHQQLSRIDPDRQFVKLVTFIPNSEIVDLIAKADLFIFASSCETFGISLLEAMAVGVPIACSNRSSLPETLKDGGEYFDPQNPESICRAIEQLVHDPRRSRELAQRARALASGYSWSRCASETWRYVVQTYRGTRSESLL
jgi:glycosyltransferase involved in cell wall biosynthesis